MFRGCSLWNLSSLNKKCGINSSCSVSRPSANQPHIDETSKNKSKDRPAQTHHMAFVVVSHYCLQIAGEEEEEEEEEENSQ